MLLCMTLAFTHLDVAKAKSIRLLSLTLSHTLSFCVGVSVYVFACVLVYMCMLDIGPHPF